AWSRTSRATSPRLKKSTRGDRMPESIREGNRRWPPRSGRGQKIVHVRRIDARGDHLTRASKAPTSLTVDLQCHSAGIASLEDDRLSRCQLDAFAGLEQPLDDRTAVSHGRDPAIAFHRENHTHRGGVVLL